MARKTTAAAAAAKQPKLAVVSEHAELKAFRKAAQTYREADEKVKLFSKERDGVKELVKGFVDKRGEQSAKSLTLTFIDEGIKWMLTGRQGYSADAGIEALTEAIKRAKGKRKELLAACIVSKPTIDNDAWARAKAEGAVDEKLRTAYESGTTKSLVWSHVGKARCPECDSVVTRQAKFCRECGHKL